MTNATRMTDDRTIWLALTAINAGTVTIAAWTEVWPLVAAAAVVGAGCAVLAWPQHAAHLGHAARAVHRALLDVWRWLK